jgi:hypothetical protein
MVGPLGAIYETEGYQQRKQWWEGVLQNSPYQDQLAIVDDKLTVHQLLATLDENPEEEVWLWMAQNAHDVCGYYWLMTQLKEYAGRIQVLYLNNLPFINEKGQIFYPVYLHEIQPKESQTTSSQVDESELAKATRCKKLDLPKHYCKQKKDSVRSQLFIENGINLISPVGTK